MRDEPRECGLDDNRAAEPALVLATCGAMPKAKKAPQVVHLAATMRVLRFHYARPAITVADAREVIMRLARRVATGDASRDDLALEAKLRKATGASVAELAGLAEDWPT